VSKVERKREVFERFLKRKVRFLKKGVREKERFLRGF